MFDKKETHHHHHHISEDAAREYRRARESEAEWEFANENPKEYMEMRRLESEKDKREIKGTATGCLVIIALSGAGFFWSFLAVVAIFLIWYPTLKKHLNS